MHSKQLTHEGPRSFALIFEIGDEVLGGLEAFVREHGIGGAHFTAIGALQDVVLGYWDWMVKDYQRIPVREQVEVLSMVGNAAEAHNGVKVHAHLVLGRSDGTTLGGHLLEAHVRPTLEVVMHETPEGLRREMDETTGLALLSKR
jgi:predicted DNA-binding protein with PD1-like motif